MSGEVSSRPLRRLASLLRLLPLLICLPGAWAETAPCELRVGVYQNPPQLAWNERAGAEGIFADVLHEVAEQEGWTLSYRRGGFSELLLLLELGEIDLLPSVALSYERLKRFDFGRAPVLTNWGVLHRRDDIVIHNLFDLEGRTVAGLDGGIHMEAFRTLLERYGVNSTLVPVSSYDEALRAVERGEADVAVVNRTFSTREGGNYRTVGSSFIFNPIPLHFAVTKDRHRDVVHALDRALAVGRGNPDSVLQASLNRWLRPPPRQEVPLWAYLGGAGLAGGVGLLLILNRMLRHMVRRRTAELERERQASVEAMRAQNLFLGTLSHELRTPLNFLRGAGDSLQEQLPANPEVKEAFLFFENGIDRLEHLSTSLLRFAELDRESFRLRSEEVDLRRLMDEVVGHARALPRDSGVDFETEILIEPGEPVRTDPDAIYQIAVNLVHNALNLNP